MRTSPFGYSLRCSPANIETVRFVATTARKARCDPKRPRWWHSSSRIRAAGGDLALQTLDPLSGDYLNDFTKLIDALAKPDKFVR